MGIVFGDGLLGGRRNQNVTLLVEQRLARVGLGVREADDGAIVVLVLLQLLRVDAVGVVDGAIVFDHSDHLAPGPMQVSTAVKADITIALDDARLACPAWCAADHRHVAGLVDEVIDAMEKTLKLITARY